MLDPSQFFVVRAVHRVEGVVRVENRLAYDIDDVDVGRFMPYPWVCRWSPTAALRGRPLPRWAAVRPYRHRPAAARLEVTRRLAGRGR